MAGQNSLINLGNLAEPAKVLIERVSDAIGGAFKPSQIKRVAKAEAEADKIRAVANLEITELRQRSLRRFVNEETMKQKNIEEITKKALPMLKPIAKPQDVQKDWIVDFFDKSRLVSDEKMQDLWARILSSEANAPESFSKRTLSVVASLDKSDAIKFNSLCNFVVNISGFLTPLVVDVSSKIYPNNGINFEILKHLDSINLISFESVAGYKRKELDKKIQIQYQDTRFAIEFQNEGKNALTIGHVIFTNVGLELSKICGSSKVADFPKYILEKLNKRGQEIILIS